MNPIADGAAEAGTTPADMQATRAVLAHWGLAGARIERITQGLVNRSFLVSHGEPGAAERYVLQCLHPSFPPEVNDNIEAVTRHLRALGALTPLLVPAADGSLSIAHDDEHWRLLTYIDGIAVDRIDTPARATAAGRLLAQFHAALASFSGEIIRVRPPVHDFARHLDGLEHALDVHSGHRRAAEVGAASVRLNQLRAMIPAFEPGPERLVHGDPKISNMLFARDSDAALCMIDLDTLARMPLAFELGDALRSWCNPCAEDDPASYFDRDIFAAALAGYFADNAAQSNHLEAAIVPATLQIYLELAARFLADALEETYFGWDASRFASRADHNLARANGQLVAADALARQLPAVQQLVATAVRHGPSRDA